MGLPEISKVCIAVGALAALLLAMVATEHGLLVSPDSVAYASAARSVASGDGFYFSLGGAELRPLTHFPPGLPAVLGGLAFAGLDPFAGARVLNALCFAGTVVLAAVLVYRRTGSRGFSLAAAAVTLTAVPMLEMHTELWSEPLFIVLTLLGILTLDIYLSEGRWVLLALSALAMAGATLTRWTGVPFIGAAVLGVVLLRPGGPLRRLARGALYGAISCLPGALWVLRNWMAGGNAANRAMAWHPITAYHVREALWTVYGWVVPDAAFEVIRMRYMVLVTSLVLAMAGWEYWRRWKAKEDEAGDVTAGGPPVLAVLVTAAYGAFLALSISLMDASTPLDDRIMSPVFVPLLVIACWVLHMCISRIGEGPVRKAAAAALCAVALVAFVPRGTAWAVGRREHVPGYLGRTWTESEVLDRLRALPEAAPLYTNDPRPIHLHLNRPARKVPVQYSPTALAANDEFLAELTRVRADLGTEGLLVYFDRSKDVFDSLPAEETLVQELGLERVADCADGAIYKLAGRPATVETGEQKESQRGSLTNESVDTSERTAMTPVPGVSRQGEAGGMSGAAEDAGRR